MYLHLYTHLPTCLYIYIYIYIYEGRERARERHIEETMGAPAAFEARRAELALLQVRRSDAGQTTLVKLILWFAMV